MNSLFNSPDQTNFWWRSQSPAFPGDWLVKHFPRIYTETNRWSDSDQIWWMNLVYDSPVLIFSHVPFPGFWLVEKFPPAYRIELKFWWNNWLYDILEFLTWLTFSHVPPSPAISYRFRICIDKPIIGLSSNLVDELIIGIPRPDYEPRSTEFLQFPDFWFVE